MLFGIEFPFALQMFLAEFRTMHLIYQVYIVASLIVFLNIAFYLWHER